MQPYGTVQLDLINIYQLYQACSVMYLLSFFIIRVRDEIRMTIAAYQTLYESRYVISVNELTLFAMVMTSNANHSIYITQCCIWYEESSYV